LAQAIRSLALENIFSLNLFTDQYDLRF